MTFTFANFGGIVGAPTGDVTGLFTVNGTYPGTASVNNSGTVLTVTLTPVPEPGALLLACGAAAGGAWWRRRHLAPGH